MRNRIFSTDSPKAIKADSFGYLNAIHYMAPHTLGGVGNLCVDSSAGCRALCLGHYSGQASMVSDLERDDNSVRKSRREKARRFMKERDGYLADMVQEISRLKEVSARKGKKLCVRLNGSTDIAWEGIRRWNGRNIFELFSDVQFVDYTKIARRFDRALPANYHLTFSRSETNGAACVGLLQRGHNVAVVFENKPAEYWGFPVVDGDQHDLRHLDPRGSGYVIGLTPKGRKAKKDTSGFVVR